MPLAGRRGSSRADVATSPHVTAAGYPAEMGRRRVTVVAIAPAAASSRHPTPVGRATGPDTRPRGAPRSSPRRPRASASRRSGPPARAPPTGRRATSPARQTQGPRGRRPSPPPRSSPRSPAAAAGAAAGRTHVPATPVVTATGHPVRRRSGSARRDGRAWWAAYARHPAKIGAQIANAHSAGSMRLRLSSASPVLLAGAAEDAADHGADHGSLSEPAAAAVLRHVHAFPVRRRSDSTRPATYHLARA